jgi:hypothetical protein
MQNCEKARVQVYVKNNVRTNSQIILEDNENEIIDINHKHQNRIIRV